MSSAKTTSSGFTTSFSKTSSKTFEVEVLLASGDCRAQARWWRRTDRGRCPRGRGRRGVLHCAVAAASARRRQLALARHVARARAPPPRSFVRSAAAPLTSTAPGGGAAPRREDVAAREMREEMKEREPSPGARTRLAASARRGPSSRRCSTRPNQVRGGDESQASADVDGLSETTFREGEAASSRARRGDVHDRARQKWREDARDGRVVSSRTRDVCARKRPCRSADAQRRLAIFAFRGAFPQIRKWCMRGRRAARRAAAARASNSARTVPGTATAGRWTVHRRAVGGARCRRPRASPLTRMRAGFAATVAHPPSPPSPSRASPPAPSTSPLARRGLPGVGLPDDVVVGPPPRARRTPRRRCARTSPAPTTRTSRPWTRARFASWLAAEARARVLSDPGASLRARARALRAHHAPTLDPLDASRHRDGRVRAHPASARVERAERHLAHLRAAVVGIEAYLRTLDPAGPGGGEGCRSQSRSDARRKLDATRALVPAERRRWRMRRGTTPRRSFATVDEPPKRSPRRATRRAWRSRNATRRTRCAARGGERREERPRTSRRGDERRRQKAAGVGFGFGLAGAGVSAGGFPRTSPTRTAVVPPPRGCSPSS